MDESVKHTMWNEEYKDKLHVKNEIPSVFVDPVIDFEYAEENEKALYYKYTSELFDIVSKKRPYECAAFCQPPGGFFSGQPWLMEPKNEKKRRQSSVSFTWQIWLKGCGDKDVDGAYKLLFNNEEIKDAQSMLLSTEETMLAQGNIKQVLWCSLLDIKLCNR